MRTYHEIAGHRGTYAPLQFEADARATAWLMRDSYCEDPPCHAPEVRITLVAVHDPNRRIEFGIDFFESRAEYPEDLSGPDLAIVKEFMSSERLLAMVQRHRSLVRAWGLARWRGGETVPSEDRCYDLGDFDLHGEHHGMLFQSDGTAWLAIDAYCVNPRCPCREATVAFARTEPGALAARTEFAARLDLRRAAAPTTAGDKPLTAGHHRVIADFKRRSAPGRPSSACAAN
jgi:hypothetical protein